MSSPRLSELAEQDAAAFAARHIGPAPDDVDAMLDVLGQPTLAALVDAAVPETIRDRTPLDLPAPTSEAAMLAELRALAGANRVMTSLIGLGYADTITPGASVNDVPAGTCRSTIAW